MRANNPNPYGPTCGHCSSAVPDHITICPSCGAHKATRTDSLTGGAILFRMLIWLQTVGLVLILTIYMTVKPWFDDSTLHGVNEFCATEIIVTIPNQFEFLKEKKITPITVANGACEDTPVAEREKARDEIIKTKTKFWPKGVEIKIGKTFTYEEIKQSPPGFLNWLQVMARSLAALMIGGYLLKWTRKIYEKIFGRLTDKMWVKK